ncbi:unnamed protein product [Soboliphyme baturini]|uniref:Gamma-interferon-inducible lysosomal thiol reductase n=1 Tax=Soboliphyme baturini TaxID=241478 RepID=A0A183J723_9BILA|nr:unnamed protein product [Soboliphyme baturini]
MRAVAGILIIVLKTMVLATDPSPLQITVLYEALCSDCMKLFTQVLSKFGPALPRFAHIELVPYGNAKRTEAYGMQQFQCQHGPQECVMNTFHSCAIHVLNNEARSLAFVTCLEEGRWKELDNHYTVSECFRFLRVSPDEQSQIWSCMVNGLGIQLQEKMARITESVRPEKHTSVPWIVINGVSTKAMQLQQDHLFQLFCLRYRGHIRPPGC